MFGFFSKSITSLAGGGLEGGGPVESLGRLLTQSSSTNDVTWNDGIVGTMDSILLNIIGTVLSVVPDFSQFDFSDFITYGYAIDTNQILAAIVISISFCMGMSILGYFSLKARELAG